MVRILGFHYHGMVQSLVGELRSHELHGVAKKRKKNDKNEKQMDPTPEILI